MAKSKLAKVNEKIAENVTAGFKKMSDGVVGLIICVLDYPIYSYLKGNK